MRTRNLSRILFIIFAAAITASAQTSRHPLRLDDLARFRNVNDPQLSPDGQWMAYASDESGQYEIYVQSFPGRGGKRQVSTGGGIGPKWAGNELFYQSLDGKLMASEDFGESWRESIVDPTGADAGAKASSIRRAPRSTPPCPIRQLWRC